MRRGIIFLGLGLAGVIYLTSLTKADTPLAAPEERSTLRPPASQPADGRGQFRSPRGEGEGSGQGRRPGERLRDLRPDGFAGGISGPPMPFRPNLNLTPEQEKEVLAWAEKNFPEQYKTYQDYTRTNPEMAQRHKQQMLRHCFAIMQLAQDEPALADTVVADIRLQEEVARTVSRWQSTTDPLLRTEIETNLNDLLTKQAQVRLENRRLRLESLSKRVDAERKRLEYEQNRVGELVQTRRAELLKPRPATSQPAPQTGGR